MPANTKTMSSSCYLSNMSATNTRAKENIIKASLLPLLGNDEAEVERTFLIIKAQREY